MSCIAMIEPLLLKLRTLLLLMRLFRFKLDIIAYISPGKESDLEVGQKEENGQSPE